MDRHDGREQVPPGFPAGQPPHTETSQPIDLSAYQCGSGSVSQRPAATEMTTSLTGWVLGNRGRPPDPAPEPHPRTARVIVLLFVTLTALVAGAAAVTYYAFNQIG